MGLLKDKFLFLFEKITFRGQILAKKFRNRTPDKLKEIFSKYVAPYGAILIIASFVFASNFVQAAESSVEFLPNEEVMDLDPYTVAKTVNAVNPYTPLIQGDAVQVALAMKDEDFLGKPVITETQNTNGTDTTTRKTTITYTVEGGDTLSSIGWEYGLKISSIKAVNGMSSDNIRPGQKIKLPPQDLNTAALAAAQKKKVAGASTAATPFRGVFGRPTRGWNLSQYFGHTSFERWHTGIDLTSRSGLAILASASGKVVSVSRGWGGGYGNHIVISHGDGFSTLYGHMSSFSVSSGQWVNQGQQIGVMGNTGWSTGTHLHFEIRKNGSAQNPLQYL